MYRNVAQLPLDFTLFKGREVVTQWSPSGSLIFGFGASARLGGEVKRMGGKKVVVTTDQGLVKLGIAKKITDSLDAAGIAYQVYDQCEPDPSVETVEKVAAMAKDADLLIGLGGGSSIDPSKAAAILVRNGGKLQDYEGCDMFPNAPLPVIAIPTTAGTGAEATPFAIITDTKKKWKMAIGGSFNIVPLAICDPELTMTLPPVVTAFTGMDALTHAIEGYVSRAADYFSEAMAEKSIKLIAGALRRATFNGEFDRQARYDMMLGSTMAAMSFCNAILGISHAMAPPLGAYFHVPHGVGNAICLPIACKFNMWSNPEKYAEIARLFGCRVEGLELGEAARLGVDCVYDLLNDLPVPPLSKYGVTEKDIPLLAEEAMKGGDRTTNPRVTTVEDFHQLFREALQLKN